MGRFAITRGQFAAFVSAKDWRSDPKEFWRHIVGLDDSHPVVSVRRDDTKAYIDWLNGIVTGRPYRVLSEAEWEYVCRAGMNTPFWWGSSGDHA